MELPGKTHVKSVAKDSGDSLGRAHRIGRDAAHTAHLHRHHHRAGLGHLGVLLSSKIHLLGRLVI